MERAVVGPRLPLDLTPLFEWCSLVPDSQEAIPSRNLPPHVVKSWLRSIHEEENLYVPCVIYVVDHITWAKEVMD